MEAPGERDGNLAARRWGEGPPRVLQACSVRRSCPSAGPSPHRRAQVGFYPAHGFEGRQAACTERWRECADKHRCHGHACSWEESDDEMSFGEAQRYDRLCYDEAAKDAYLKGAATIIANTLG